MSIYLLRVFEHQTLRIGDRQKDVEFTQKHFEILTTFHSKAHKYYSLLHQGIKFSHYVGVLQVEHLTIEILPKADKAASADPDIWQGVLLDMLRYCRLLKVEALSSARLRLRSHSILDLYFEIFLAEVENLLQTGLIKSYRRQTGQANTMKGKLVLSKHLSSNAIHKERFFIDYQTYDYEHQLHQILYEALLCLGSILHRADLRARQQRLLRHFPPQKRRAFYAKDFRHIHYNRQTLRYQKAIEIARLLLLNYHPDLKGGQERVLAIMFDMNLLFEEYVYQQLKRLPEKQLRVSRQQSTTFWNRRTLRPDLVVDYQNQRFVLDTKWKVLQHIRPDMKDIKQMYIYNRFFGATRGVLLYPQVYQLPNLPPLPYHSIDEDNIYCQVNFVHIIKEGQLNPNIGQELLLSLVTVSDTDKPQ